MTPVSDETELFGLPLPHVELQAEARATAAVFGGRAGEVRQHLLDHGEMHPELWSAFCEHEWPGLVLPAQRDRRGAGLLGMTLVLEAFAEQGIWWWMPVLPTAISYAISVVGSEPARDEWLERAAGGEAFFGMAPTEPEVGHNLFGSSTEIRRDGEHFVINGLKRVTSGLDMVEPFVAACGNCRPCSGSHLRRSC